LRLYEIHFWELLYKAGDIHSWFFVWFGSNSLEDFFEPSPKIFFGANCRKVYFFESSALMRGGAFFVSSDFGNYELRGTNFDRLRWRAVFGEFALAANGRRQWHNGYTAR